MKVSIFILTLCLFGISCKHSEPKQIVPKDNSVSVGLKEEIQADSSQTLNIKCDSIYKDKGYTIKLIALDDRATKEIDYFCVFSFLKQNQGKEVEIFRDTLESTAQKIKFHDFNGDHIKDILIQKHSDVRSNWTYTLYLVDTEKGKLKKIKGFDEIKNPNYLSKYDLVDTYVNSGTNWTSFHKIQGDSVINFGIEIMDRQDGNYEKEHKKTINKILAQQ